jgi:exopolyphosphatase/guanosine-5'-triphosphate,3'-diphosphate pyrophosphatase
MSGANRPVAVIDIGSNSVRLVIFERRKRNAAVLHNEKAICAIGRHMVKKGRLDEEGIELALKAFDRFRELCEGHEVRDCFAVATAAARDAENGRDFIRRAEKKLGCTIDVLSGEEEARIAAEGVLAGIPGADGIVADLGGGSLDMATVAQGRAGDAASLPFGPLRLMDLADDSTSKARDLVEKGLKNLGLMKGLKGRTLYAVGGIWRALARLEMEREDYPLHVLHHYVIPSSRALKLCKVVAGLGRKSLEKMAAVPRRRAEALPYGAAVMESLIEVGDLKDVVISAYGLREGVFYRELAPEERAKNPLIEFATEVNNRVSRTPGHAVEMFDWMSPLFNGESKAERHIRETACLLSDIGWRRHPDDRALGTFAQVLRGPYAGADHYERTAIATSVYYRYAGDADVPEDINVASLLGKDGTLQALRVGLAARLAFALTSAIEGELPKMSLKLTSETVTLQLPPRREALLGEIIAKRLDDLAEAFNRKGETVIR